MKPRALLSRLSCLRLVALALAGLLLVSPAAADELAPELESADLRQLAQSELKRLVSALPAGDRRRLVGIYAAFDDDGADPAAQVACDDDGDYVVVVSDAMLRLASHVARALAYEDGGASRRVEEYAGFVSRGQVPGHRLVPPPPGFYTAAPAGPAYDERLREVLSFIVARELTHLRAGDLVCPHPTATKESGDDAWTAIERRRAREIAGIVYPGRGVERDQEATARVLDVGRTERGALGLLRFFQQLEIERRSADMSRFEPRYAALHPGASARLAIVDQAALAHRRN